MVNYTTKRKLQLRPVLEKKAEIETALTDLKARREAEEKVFTQVSEDLAHKREEMTSIDLELRSLELNLFSFAEYCQGLVNECFQTLQDAEDTVQKFLGAVKALDQRILDQQEILARTKQDEQDAHTRIVAEQEVISRQRADLDIYKARLQKYIDESGADIKLIL